MIVIRSDEEIAKLEAAGRLVAQTHALMRESVAPGVSTARLDTLAEEFIRDHGAEPAFKGYRGFPATICASVNEAVVHGIPDEDSLAEGDIIGIDLGVKLAGYYGDAAVTYTVGEVDETVQQLLDVTETALEQGIEQAQPGNHLSDISHAIQVCAEAHDYSVVKNYVGHGVGTELHEDPQIPNFGPPGQGPELRTGMIFAIEPMVNIGGDETRTLSDSWTVVTDDGSLSAHFEHTIAIQDDGPQILTVA